MTTKPRGTEVGRIFKICSISCNYASHSHIIVKMNKMARISLNNTFPFVTEGKSSKDTCLIKENKVMWGSNPLKLRWPQRIRRDSVSHTE